MGGGTVDDGRLDLDDLGDVVDAPGGESAPEVLDDGRGYTWADRLEGSGVTPWLRRHRLAVAGVATAAVLVAAGVTAYVRLTPPPLDPTLHVTVTDAVPSGFLEEGDLGSTFDVPGVYTVRGDIFRAAYAVTPTDPQDAATYAIVGLDGPAVRASTAHAQSTPSSVGGPAEDVDVVVDCYDRAALLPAPGSYSLRVARTDDLGRTVVGSIPLDDTAVGWPASVASNCAWRQTFDSLELRSARVRTDERSRAVSLDLDVVNRLPQDVLVSDEPVGGAPSVSHALTPTRVPAGEAVTLTTRLLLHDCGSPTLNRIGFDRPGSDPSTVMTPVPGAFLTIDVVPSDRSAAWYPRPRGGTPVLWSESFAREIDAALARACAGAPRTQVSVTRVGPASTVDEPLPGDGHADTRLPVTFEVAAAGATRVYLGSPAVAPYEYVGSRLAPSSVRAAGGRAVIRTTWSIDCAGGGSDLSPLQVAVHTADGDFPFLTTVTSATLEDAVLAACARDGIGQLRR